MPRRKIVKNSDEVQAQEQKEIEPAVEERPKPQWCRSCTNLIGEEFIEPKQYRVGEFVLCGRCRNKLAKNGHIELDGRRQTGGGSLCRWLYADGTIKTMKLTLSPEIHYTPFMGPVPVGAGGAADDE